MASRLPPPSTRRPGASSSQASSDPEPDKVIGEFRRGKEIGKGSFATVYLVQHSKKKSYAAVKAVEVTKLSRKLRDNLTSEIAILKNLRHPHIVQLFVCEYTPMFIYLVMEYCQLADLAQFLKKRHILPTLPETEDYFRRYPNPENGGLNEVMSRHFFQQIASALQYLRSKNLIHRDIKPQNLLLNPAPVYWSKRAPEDIPMSASEQSLIPTAGLTTLPQLKVADFGFARHLPSTSMAETLCGSPLYMAPEILRYEKYDARSDLWSAGAVLYEMVVGKPPFRAQNHVDLLRKIEKANDIIPFDSKNMYVSRDVKNCVRGLLTKNPLERMTYEQLFECAIVVNDIPNLAPEDRLQLRPQVTAEVSELSRKMASAMEVSPHSTPEQSSSVPKQSQDDEQRRTSSRKTSEQDMQQRRAEDVSRRKSSSGSQNVPEGVPIKRQPSQREQRRPSMVPHITAPGRQELHHQGSMGPPAAPMQRRASRSSPLAGPPLVRETTLEAENANDERSKREARERTANELTFEKEYVVIEKRAVEVNAFADELDAVAAHGGSSNRGAIVRRATTQGQPTSVTGAQPASPSRAMQVVSGRTTHQRAGSFERRYAPSPQSATNMLTKALNAANVRLFGALGTSPPYGKGLSPPRGYGAFPAFPAYPTPQGALTAGDERTAPMDEDSKLVRTMEDAAHRSDVIFGFAEVKYRQLIPATPSAQDALGIQQIGAQEGSKADEDPDMTTVAIVTVAEEALVLYVKALAILTKTIDLAGYWWGKRDRVDAVAADPSSNQASNAAQRVLNVVKWSRTRFNESLEKSEVVGRKLQLAQRQLPEDHPGHPDNQSMASGSGGVTTSAEHIQICSGITAERLMFDRAVEMSRAAAVSELVGEDLHDCELGYKTAIMLLEAVLEGNDEPLMRKPSTKSARPGDEIINGMETEDRQTVIKLIDSARSRLHSLRKKIHLLQQQGARRATTSGNSTPRPGTSVPGTANTPPKVA